jgi:APA family basic amino acid/polyamine antiporter
LAKAAGKAKASHGLQRTLNLPQLIFYGVGTIVGAGIYSVIGAAAGQAGAHLWVSFLLAGTAAFLTVLSYAELASVLPKAGGEYQYVRFAFGKLRILAFLAGFLIAVNAAATAATVSIAFAGYMRVFLDLPGPLISVVLLALCTAVNIRGIRESTWASIALICVEIGGLIVMIACGVIGGAWEKLTAPESFDPGAVFGATALIFFVYIGFEDIINLSEESIEPKKNVPRALLTAVLTTSMIYLLVALATISLVSPETLAGSDSPLEAAASQVSPAAGKALAVSALFATASTALISLISISRLLFGMAREGDMPKPLANLLPGRNTPWVAALVLFVMACGLLPLGKVEIVASISSFGTLLVFITVQAGVIRLRFTKPGMTRGFRVPLAIGRWPVLPTVGILFCAALLTRFAPLVYAIGVGALVFGTGLYFVLQRTRAH